MNGIEIKSHVSTHDSKEATEEPTLLQLRLEPRSGELHERELALVLECIFLELDHPLLVQRGGQRVTSARPRSATPRGRLALTAISANLDSCFHSLDASEREVFLGRCIVINDRVYVDVRSCCS